MKQSILTYSLFDENRNPIPVQFFHCFTRSFNQEHVTDPSGIDHEYARITVTVDGFLRIGGYSDLSNGVRVSPSAFASLGGQWREISNRIYHARGVFNLSFSANEDGSASEPFLVVQPQDSSGRFQDANGYFDVCGGPRCKSFDIRGFVGGGLARVTATFVLCIVPCEVPSDQDTRVLVNRWSVQDEIDQDWYTTRTYTGRLKVSSPQVSPNLFRGLCLPVLSPGMKPRRILFDVSQDGLTLAYTFIHKEAAYSPPAPCTSWHLIHTESTADDKLGVGTIQVSMRGDRNVDKRELMAIASRIIELKLIGPAPGAQERHYMIQDLTIVDVMSSDQPAELQVRCTITHMLDVPIGNVFVPAATIGIPFLPDDFIETPAEGYDVDKSPNAPGGDIDPLDEDGNKTTAGVSGPVSLIGAFSTYLQSNCGQFHSVADGLHPVEADLPRENEPEWPPVGIRKWSEVSVELPPWYSVEMADSAYADYRIESRWESDQNKILLPIAESSSNSSSGDTAKIVGLGLQTTKRIIRIRAERIGKAPSLQKAEKTLTLSSPHTSTPKLMILLKAIVLPSYMQNAEGKTIFIVDAEYHYGLTRALDDGDDMLIGIDASLVGPVKYLPGAALNSLTENNTVAGPATT